MNFLATPTGRKVLFGSLYLSEGAPIGFLWWALPTQLRSAGVPVDQITALTSLLVLPWVLKFVWAPLVDVLRTPRWSLRAWIITSQLLMGATLVPLFVFDLEADFAFVVPFLLAHAFFAATQDVSVDTLSINTVPIHERGSINGWMQAGMLTGRSLLGGGALVLGETIGTKGVYLALVAIIWSSTVLVFLSREEEILQEGAQTVRDVWRGFTGRIAAAVKRRSMWFGLLFAMTAGAGFEAAGSVAGPFLIDRGFNTGEVGTFFGLPVIAAMIGGAILGGTISDRIGRRFAVGLFLGVLTLNIVAIAAVDWSMGEDGRLLTYGLLVSMYLCIGLFTASSYALFMDLTDPRLGATQFSAFMGATNACESWATFTVGRLIVAAGYPLAFLSLAAASLVGLPLLQRMRGETSPEGTGPEGNTSPR